MVVGKGADGPEEEIWERSVENIKKAVDPTEILFVVDSMTGQDAVNTALEFNKRLNYDGVILTKLDGDTRGGAALSIRSVVNKPIKFASTGEKLDALTPFYPTRMAQRMKDTAALKEMKEGSGDSSGDDNKDNYISGVGDKLKG